MAVFAAGGTGVIGRRLIPMLITAGHQVTAATRSPGKAGLLRILGAEPAVADGLDRGATREADRLLAGGSVVSLMTQIRGSSNARARRELGWAPRYASWRPGFATRLGDNHDAERATAGAAADGRA